MYAIINVALPVFAIMAAGYLCGRFRLLGLDSTKALNGFVYYMALPALFLVSMARAPVAEIFNGPYLATLIGAQLAVFGLAVIVATFAFPGRLGSLGQHGLAAMFSNTGYMGIPLLITAFGEMGAMPAIIATVINGAIVMAFGIAILELDKSENTHPLAIAKDVALGVVKSPLVMAAVAGIAVSALGWTLPTPIETFLNLTGAAAAPTALFAMGLFLVGQSLRSGLKEVGWVVGLKLVVHPLITWWLATEVLNLSPLYAASAVVLASLPTGGLVFLLSERYDVYKERSAGIILLSTVMSVVTVSAILSYYVSG